MAKEPCNLWIKAIRADNNHLIVKDQIDNKIVAPLASGAIGLAKFGEQLYVSTYYDANYLINSDLKITGILPIDSEDPTDTNDGVAYVRNLDFFDDDTNKYVALVSQARHIVRIYDQSDYTRIGQVGEYNTVGNVADNRLNEPRDCHFLPSGNLLIASRFGQGTKGQGLGHVSEYDPLGNFVATRLEGSFGKESAIGLNVINRPTKIRIDPDDVNYIWIAETQGRILKVNTTTWLCEDIIFRPLEYDINTLESFCFLTGGLIAIASIALGKILIMDFASRNIVDVLDPLTVGGNGDVRDIFELRDGFLAVACWSNRSPSRGIFTLPLAKFALIQYDLEEIPTDYEVASDKVPLFYKTSNNIAEVPIECLHLVRDELAIPLRKKC